MIGGESIMKMRSLEIRRNNRNGFLFALPWIIGFICFSVYPLAASLYYSFTAFNPVTAPRWVGLENYRAVWSDPLVLKSLMNTLFIAFVSTPVNLLAALLLGVVATKKIRFQGLVRTLFFLPSIIPAIAATMVWIWMFDPTYGYINTVLRWFGINGPAWLMDMRYTKAALLLMGIWCTGTAMLICMAALEEVPVSYYESAEMDGVGPVRKFIYITLPSIAHVLVYQAILNLINAFQYFQQVYIITNASTGAGAGAGYASGGPGNSILMYPLYIFHNAFVYLKMGKASAMAWLLFIIVALLARVMTKASKSAVSNAGVE
jgi:multiple sugar transport system permease protein